MIVRTLALALAGIAGAIAAPAERIVTLSPSGAELVIAAGAGARLVGVAGASELPAAMAALPIVASPGRIDLERIATLKPDLVITWPSGNPAASLARLQAAGMRLLPTEPRRLSDLAAYVRTIGELAGTAPAANAAAAAFERELAAVGAASGQRVFIEIWPAPLMTVNGQHLISDVLRHCGAINVFAAAPVLTPRIGIEDLIAARPEVILTSADLRDPAQTASWRDARRYVAAVTAGRVVQLDAALLHRQSFAVLAAVRTVCASLARVP